MTEPSISTKAQHKRQQILEAALVLFQKGPYEKVTMRAIAKQAGVAVGAAYYYFETKEHLIQAFYWQSFERFSAEITHRLQPAMPLTEKLRAVLASQISTAAPFQGVSRLLFKAAVDPQSPLSPLSEASAPLRHRIINLYRSILHKEVRKLPQELADDVPLLLWFFHMAVITFWIFDRSPGQRRTWLLIEKLPPLVARFIHLARFRLAAPLLQSLIDFLNAFAWFRSLAPAKQQPSPEGGST